MSADNLLVVRIGAMGDVLHALPAVAALRTARPGMNLAWAVDSRWAPLLVGDDADGPLVSQIHRAETRLWKRSPWSRATFRDIRALRGSLRSTPVEQVVDMQGTLRSAVIGSWAAQREAVCGFSDPRERAARLLYGRSFARRGVHVVEQGAALLGDALGIVLEAEAPKLPHVASADRWAESLLQEQRGTPVAVLAPTAGWGAKEWPARAYATLARRMGNAGWRVLVNAATETDPVGTEVVRGSEGAATLLACGLEQLIALLRRVNLVVGNDSGPVHLAAAVGTPLVALYGPTDPARNGPWGPGAKAVLRHPSSVTSHRRVLAVDPGLAQIPVEAVLDAVNGLRD